MGEEIRDNCGIAAASAPEDSEARDRIVYSLYKLLLNMQNRGQLSAGITTFNRLRNQILDTHKALGYVNDVFRINDKQKAMRILTRYAGNQGIGHVRYATFGSDKLDLAQPFERHHGRLWKWFSFCFNGNLANFNSLKDELLSKHGYHIVHNSDTEIMMHSIARELKDGHKDLKTVFSNLAAQFDGAYNIAFMQATGEMAIVRDPLGIRPLSYGTNNGSVFAASETNALSACGVYEPVALKPGEMLLLKHGKHEVVRYARSARKAHCMFEWVYFSNLSSIIDGISVYDVRRRLGVQLAKDEKLKIDKDTIIVPVPETSKCVCDAMAYELGTVAQQGLIRNRYLGRTFIESCDREDMVRNKFTVMKDIVQGKKVILVDDSIVRGTTSKRLIKFLKEIGGAKEVHMRVSCPPITGPCFYGIDMSTISELLVPRYHDKIIEEKLPEGVIERIASDLDADSLHYMTHSGLVKAIGLPKKDLCMACLNGEYPTGCGKALFCEARKNFLNGEEKKRAYE